MSGDFNGREKIIEDLHKTADPLLASCDTVVVKHINEAIQEVEQAWNETCGNLKELYAKYQRAVELWEQISEMSANVNTWIDEQMCSLDKLKPSPDQIQVIGENY